MSWLFLALLGTAQADDLRLILNDPTARPGPLDKCDVALCTSLKQLIDEAETSIDMAFYGFRNQSALFDSLKKAKARGVKIRIVVDMDVAGVNYYKSTPLWMDEFEVRTDHAADLAKAANQRSFGNIQYKCPRPAGFEGPLQCLAVDLGGDRCLLTAHVSEEDISFKGDIMHDKFAVVDGREVWMGSTNASDSGTGGYNANLVMVVDSPTVAGWYTNEFEQMWEGQYHDKKTPQEAMRTQLSEGVHVSTFFSPQHKPIENQVRPILQSARERIDIAVFFLTHKGVTEDLIAAKNRGVQVRVILDGTAAKNGYTKHEILRAAGIPVKIEDWGGKMHAKSAVIDGETVIGGSMNWTAAGERGNDENTIVLRSRVHAAQYQAWFDKLWSAIPDRWLEGRPDPESWDSGTACTDGVDNDCDDLDDEADPGCSKNPPPLPPLPPQQIVSKKEGVCAWEILDDDRDE